MEKMSLYMEQQTFFAQPVFTQEGLLGFSLDLCRPVISICPFAAGQFFLHTPACRKVYAVGLFFHYGLPISQLFSLILAFVGLG